MDQFAWELRHHPNRQVCNFVLDGLRNGFKLGFQPTLSLKSAKKNKSSAYQQPLVIDEYLAHEVPWGRVVDPFRSFPLPNLHISSFGVIPEEGQPGKWRLIVDLSSPGGASFNHGINAHEFTLHYAPINVKPAGGQGMGWGFDCLCWPEVGHLTDLVLPGEGIFESFFARRGDI